MTSLTKTKDILYVVKNDGTNEDLKYSLRSLETYGDGYWRVFLVTDKAPEWINTQNVNVIIRPLQYYKERDIMDSIVEACKSRKLSKDFIFFNDDFYLLSPTDFSNYPVYVRPYDLHHYVWADTRVHLRWRRYTRIIEKTYQALVARDLPILTYDIHLPMVFNKKKFPVIMSEYDWNCPFDLGLTFRSIYGNTLKLPATPITDVKLDKIVTYTGLVNYLSKQAFVSSGDNSEARKMLIEYLQKRFPNKSIWENS